MLVSEFGINILQSFFFFLLFLDTGELILHFLIEIFKQTLFEGGDRFVKSVELVINGALSGKDLCFLHEVLANSFFEQFFSSGNLFKSIVVLLSLNVAGSLVIVVEWLIGVVLNCFLVEVDGLIEVFLLELFVSFVLEIFSRVFNLHFLRFLLFLLLFSLGGRWGRGSMLLLFFCWLLFVKLLLFEHFLKIFEVVRL